MTISEILKNARLEKGFTIYRLSKITGLAESVINRIENNVIKQPGFITVARIAEALDLSLDEIYNAVKQEKE